MFPVFLTGRGKKEREERLSTFPKRGKKKGGGEESSILRKKGEIPKNHFWKKEEGGRGRGLPSCKKTTWERDLSERGNSTLQIDWEGRGIFLKNKGRNWEKKEN